MNTEIIESCYNELINEINNIKKQIEAINLKMKEKQKEVEEARANVCRLVFERDSLNDETGSLYARLRSLNGLVEMLKPYKEENTST